MRDPHTKDSRGFAFVTMELAEDADTAISSLNATELMGRTMNVEKARRGRARTRGSRFLCSSTSLRTNRLNPLVLFLAATPGQYHGPPKRCPSLVLSLSLSLWFTTSLS